MKRKLISLITAVAMAMSLFGAIPITAGAETFSGGTGTEGDPYQIADLAAFTAFRDSVNGGNTYEGKTVTLTADIDLSSVCGADIGGAEASWTPIGDSHSFNGMFDGGKHKITGLYINASDSDNQGLFGVVGSDGEVKNLGVDGTVSGGSNVGGVVGNNNGIVTSCYNTGTVSGSSNVGGIAGIKSGTTENCYNTGAVSGTNDVGGVVGALYGGGVENCYNTGAVSGSSNVGGVLGNCSGGFGVFYCYSIGAVSGSSNVGGVVGNDDDRAMASCYYDNTVYTAEDTTIGVTGMPTADFALQTNFSSWKFDSVWTMSEAHSRPILTAIPEPIPHKHDMSVECGQTDAVNFEHALTSENGKLYIDGAVLEPTVETSSTYIDLPEGNYYLADNVTLANFMKIKGGVNLCLNGHTLDMGENQIKITKTNNGTEQGNLKLCDCGEGGQITGAYNGASNIAALIETSGEFSMYGGSVINTSNGNLNNKQAVSAFTGTVRLYGGEVVSYNSNAVMVDFNTGTSLHLSGAPKITGAANRADIYLDNKYIERIITLDAPLTITSPYRVAADGENVFTSGWNEHMSGKDFSDYFISATKGKFIAKDENNELAFVDYAITEQPSAVNSYTITANGAPASYKWYGAEVVTEAVTDQNASVYEAYDNTSSYNSETGLWTGVEKMMNTYYFQDLDLSKGDIVKVTPSESLNNVYAYLSGDNSGSLRTKTTNADGEYVFTAAADDKYMFYFSDYYSDIPSVKATVTKNNKGEAAAGQTKAQFTGGISGTYICEVSYADGTVLRSDVFDYVPVNYEFGIKYENGKAVVTAKQDGTYTVIFASYDGDGKLLNLCAEDKTLQKGENEPIEPKQGFVSGEKVKVMLWDSLNGMKPLCAADGN